MFKFTKSIAIAIILISFNNVYSQMPGMGKAGGQNMNMGHFYGKIIDASTTKPIEGATVQLVQNKMDTIIKKKRDFILSTMLSDKKGEFSIENLPIMASFKLRITAVGFKAFEEKATFEMNTSGSKPGDYSAMMNSVDKDLGNIKLTQDSKQLENVTVVASKPLLQLALDKKIYNVDKDIAAAGGSALDVMKNVPSVNVDIDGNVTLRNAPPQIFIDGRPTTLSLDQIPADQIANVEIMTNPSAKYDASGGGSGILNIVLKKNRKAGYNGNVRAGIDSRARPSGGGDINLKQNKINLFAAGMAAFRKSISTVNSTRTDYLGMNTSHLMQNNGPETNGFFRFGRLGMDYFIDNRNTITVSGNMVRGKFKTEDRIDIFRDTVKPTIIIRETGFRNSATEFNFYNYGSALGFKHNFARAGKELTADVNYNYSKNDNLSNFNSQYFDANKNPKYLLVYEQGRGGGDTKTITSQTDFVNPFSKTQKVEMGLRMSARSFTSFNNNYIKDFSGNFILIPGLGNNYNFNDVVYAAYSSYSQQIKKFSFQTGLRVESSEYEGDLITKGQQFSNKYPLSLFPSAFLSYKLNDKQDIQLNYSRKINRPNFFQLIPFIDFSDSLNLSVGNPDLLPEFTNLVEIAHQVQYANSSSLLTSIYGRNTDNLITRYQYRDKNPNPLKTDSVLFSTFANAQQSYTIGLELTGKNKIKKWWDVTTNFNLFDVTIKAANLPGSDDNSRLSWFAKLNNSFKLPKNYSIQLTADYQSKTLLPASGGASGGGRGGGGGMFGGGGGFGQNQSTAQGYIKPVYGADISFKKEFLKNNAASLTLQFNDILRTKLYASHAENALFIQDNDRRRDPQIARLNFNWRFGKFDVALFKRKNLKGEMENMQNMQQGPSQ